MFEIFENQALIIIVLKKYLVILLIQGCTNVRRGFQFQPRTHIYVYLVLDQIVTYSIVGRNSNNFNTSNFYFSLKVIKISAFTKTNYYFDIYRIFAFNTVFLYTGKSI